MYEFIVRDGDLDGHVNILQKACSCREFQLDQLLCEYALGEKHDLYITCVLIIIPMKYGLQHTHKQSIMLAHKKNERF